MEHLHKGPFIIYTLGGGGQNGGGGSCKVHLVQWGGTCFFGVLRGGGGCRKKPENIVAPVYI